MGFKKKNYRKNYQKRGSSRPKLAVAGAISLVIGVLLVHFVGVPVIYSQGKFDDNPGLVAGMVGIVGGVLMLLFSLSKKRQGQVVRGMDAARKAFDDNCNCCKCINCNLRHNHWTHD